MHIHEKSKTKYVTSLALARNATLLKCYFPKVYFSVISGYCMEVSNHFRKELSWYSVEYISSVYNVMNCVLFL